MTFLNVLLPYLGEPDGGPKARGRSHFSSYTQAEPLPCPGSAASVFPSRDTNAGSHTRLRQGRHHTLFDRVMQ